MATKKKTPLGPKAQLMKKSVDQLKRKAKQLKIQGYSTKKKEQLVNSIMMAEARAKRKPGTRKKKAATGTVKKVTATVTMAQKRKMPGRATTVKPKVKMRRPMMAQSYNGWTNYETWLINMYFDQTFIDYVTEQYGTDASLYSQDYAIGDELHNLVDEISYDVLQGDGSYWISDLVNKSLNDVNWRELANSTIDSIVD
jgi:hypothetical protein